MKKEFSSFKKSLFSILKFILLIAVCISASIVLVWPLWKFSTSLPKVYTALVLSILAAALLFFLIRKIIKSNKISVIKFAVNLVTVFAGLFFSIRFVIFEKKLIALIIFLGAIGILVLFNWLMAKIARKFHD
ncbi:MAG: hypothetical protein MJ188_03475 [Treponema sp.]|nr:hypothetical protein [Treponema sp.]